MTKPTDTALTRRFVPTALITGASDGLDRALAMDLADRGFNLAPVAWRAAVLQQIARNLAAQRGTSAVHLIGAWGAITLPPSGPCGVDASPDLHFADDGRVAVRSH